MKRLSLVFGIILILSVALSAQTKFTEIKVGLLNPANAKTGFLGGFTVGRAVDDNVGVGIAMDVYRKSYTKDVTISDAEVGGTQIDQVVKNYEESTTLIPLYLQVQYQGPVMPMLNIKVTGGLGYELLWNSYTNYNTKNDDTQFFSGWGWHIDVGAMYPLSPKTDLFAEVLYHGGTPSHDEGKTDAGAPLRSEVDMSGLGFRIGIRLYNIGF